MCINIAKILLLLITIKKSGSLICFLINSNGEQNTTQTCPTVYQTKDLRCLTIISQGSQKETNREISIIVKGCGSIGACKEFMKDAAPTDKCQECSKDKCNWANELPDSSRVRNDRAPAISNSAINKNSAASAVMVMTVIFLVLVL